MSDERSPTAENSGSCLCRLAVASAPDTHQPEELLQGWILRLLQELLGFFFFILILFVLTLLYKGTGTKNGYSLLTARPMCMLRSILPRAVLPTTTLIQPELRSTDRAAAAGGHSLCPCFTAKRMGLESVKRKSHL